MSESAIYRSLWFQVCRRAKYRRWQTIRYNKSTARACPRYEVVLTETESYLGHHQAAYWTDRRQSNSAQGNEPYMLRRLYHLRSSRASDDRSARATLDQ